MGRKRKRHSPDKISRNGTQKRVKTIEKPSIPLKDVCYNYPVLSLYYSHVSSLREYLLHRLPPSARSSRRNIKALGSSNTPITEDHVNPLVTLLDAVVVGHFDSNEQSIDDIRRKELIQFSQTQLDQTVVGTAGYPAFSQAEIVDFAIWTLFNKTFKHLQGQWKAPQHLLCHGSRLSSINGISGVTSHYPNQNVAALKASPWKDIPPLLGSHGDGIILSLLLDCGLFVPVHGGRRNLCQLSGLLLSEMPLLDQTQSTTPSHPLQNPAESEWRAKPVPSSLSAIVFARSRMFYSRPTMKGKGQVRFGLPHAHVLNRFPDADDRRSTAHIMKYIFPRQFGLHNVFTCSVKKSETNQRLQDYTDREHEIAQSEYAKELKSPRLRDSSTIAPLNLPKRLRGQGFALVQAFRMRHEQSAYTELLRYYCPRQDVQTRWSSFPTVTQECSLGGTGSSGLLTQALATDITATGQQSTAMTDQHPSDVSMMDYATPSASVSAFCRAAMRRLVPLAFFGGGEWGLRNRESVLRSVDHFINLRKKENMSLHQVCQGLKISAVEWLFPPKLDLSSSTSKSDMAKRTEIFQEFIYYLFDSLLLPLVRSNFYVTESGVHSNRLFFFRHDTWWSLSEPSLASLKLSMLEEIKTAKAKQLLDSRLLGFSQLRLLPKAKGARPIINFKRQTTKSVNGKIMIVKSINKLLEPVFNMLTYERKAQPDRLGSSMFSQGEMYPKLKAYRSQLLGSDNRNTPLYFVKVDVKACYNTIPQSELLKYVNQLTSEDVYRISKYTVIKTAQSQFEAGGREDLKPIKKWKSRAQAEDDFSSFYDTVNEDLASTRKGAVFMESGNYQMHDTGKLLRLLDQHVKANIIKVDQKYYRQKCGIPQGSVLSSILCNFFYADMERKKLDFLDGDSLLLRHTDDFLLVTTNRQHARRFLLLMHDGHPDYGISVNPAKSLVNFEVAINGVKVPRLCGGFDFPYLGDFINTRTLAISTDSDRKKQNSPIDTLTVELAKAPGRNFSRKVLGAFKIQTHARFLDTAFNSVPSGMSNIYQNFIVTAMKFYRYIKSLPPSKQPHVTLITETIRDLIWLAYNLIKSMKFELAPKGYECVVTKTQIQWLACKAFLVILGRKQSKFRPVLEWLGDVVEACKPRTGDDAMRLRKAIRIGAEAYQGFRY